MWRSCPRAIHVSILLSTTNQKSQSPFGTLFFCIRSFCRFARNSISRYAAWFWFFQTCLMVCNFIHIWRVSFKNCFPLPVNYPATSVTKRSVIPTSSVKSTSACPASDRAVIATTFVNLPCVNTFAQVFPLIDLTLDNKVSASHVLLSKGLCMWR